jgi:hydroxymethylbilane synthase
LRSLKLGTRKSLLAWSQSQWVARELERLTPGVRVELVGIETRGDRISIAGDVPLSQIQGKEFFVAEIDEALASRAVDLTVHSMKDLSLERPEAFVRAAIPRRENPRDVVLFGPGAREKLARGQALRVGTSSPRRLENIPPFLARALPTVDGHSPRVELVEIRGNVNTRLGRVYLEPGDPKALDAVVLAFAGLIRLERGAPEEARHLLRDVRWMVLPLRESPAAPAQGALAVECRADDAEAREIIGRLHDPLTERQVGRERQLLAEWGGGCHQRFGATCVSADASGELLYVRGVRPDGVFVDELRYDAPAWRGKRPVRAWDGAARDRGEISDLGTAPVTERPAWFVAHSRALPEAEGWRQAASAARVWTSGASSWFRLAERGIWVEGCAEGLGFEAVAPTLSEAVLALPSRAEWAVLTHRDATEGWPGFGTRAATYALAPAAATEPAPGHPTGATPAASAGAATPAADSELANATHAFWSSGSQFAALAALAPRDCVHACGPGKTFSALRASGAEPLVFPSVEEWRQWIKT